MTMRRNVARAGAAVVFAGLAVLGPQVCVAYADEAADSPAAGSGDARAAGPARSSASPARQSRTARGAMPIAAADRGKSVTKGARSVGAPDLTKPPAAASVSKIDGSRLNQALTNTANRLAQSPGGPVNDLLEGAIYLARRTLFPTSVGVVNKPIMVPVYPTDVFNSKNKKLGIYITLGSAATPALFELDTGGPGIYGAYASNNPNNSDWWGDGVVTTSTPVSVVYDSGISYTGKLATSQVSIYSAGGATPLLSTNRADVGQMNTITNGNTALWTPDGLPPGVSTPPIDDAFYGDFGLAQQYAKDGITNVLAQLSYTNGVKAGYRIHTDPAADTAWLQIGLTKADLQDPSAFYYPAVIDPQAPPRARNPHSGLRYYAKQVFQANIKVSDPAVILNSIDVGMTADTGAPTTLHNTDLAPLPLPNAWKSITQDGFLKQGLTFTVTGTTTDGTQGQVYSFTTMPPNTVPADGVVGVQNDKAGNTVYYLNTGIYLFYVNDVVYGLGDRKGGGVIGLVPKGA